MEANPKNPPDTPAAAQRGRPERALLWRDILAFLLKLGVTALAGWLLLGVIFGLAAVEGESMYPRLRDGDLMIYFRIQQDYHTGDVVTFTRGGQRFTGRIVALGGDQVELGENGDLLVNGNVQNEEIFYPTYLPADGIILPCQVPQGSVFLLCDFRTAGTDSRSYGAVEMQELDGKVITILRRRGI